MANSKKLANQPASVLSHVQQFLAEVLAAQGLARAHLLIGFSGGLDSSVLLHVLAALREMLNFKLSAIHVHHGLSPHADAWANFCAKTCHTLAIPLQLQKVNLDCNSGLGVEATARNARYKVFSQCQADFICLAHHQNDQAETLLLQLARGAGVKGLAAMAPVSFERKLLRPLLNLSRAELQAYAQEFGVKWIEDESNDDTHYDRNLMRHTLLPAFQARYPAIVQTLSRSAENMAEASNLLDELALLDAEKSVQNNLIHLEIFNALSQSRRANLMRWWLGRNQIAMPNALHLHQILQQSLLAKSDTAIKIKVAEGQYLRGFHGYLYLVNETVMPATLNQLWQGEPEMLLLDNSRLVFQEKLGEGLLLPQGGRLRIKHREGGERFRPQLGRPSRTLQHVLQASAIPPWQRVRLPLIFMDETLAYIPSLGAAAELQAKPHETGYVITWFASAQ